MSEREAALPEVENSELDAEADASSAEDQLAALREQEAQLNLPSSTEAILAVVNAKNLGEAMRILAPDLESLSKKKRGKYGKRKHLSEEERQELTRKRNRENARSTRLRRKLYIEHLGRVIETLKEEQERLEVLLARQSSKPPQVAHLQHQQEQLREVVLRFFQLRSCGHLQPQVWAEVVTPDVVLKLPMTTYRAFDPSELAAQGRVRQCTGVEGVLADTASLLNLCKHLCILRRCQSYWCEYVVPNNKVLVQDDRAMCSWQFTLAPATAHPQDQHQPPFLQSQGMASFRFRDMKICEVELKFDVVNVIHQINATATAPTSSSNHQHPLQATASNTGLPVLDLDFLDDAVR